MHTRDRIIAHSDHDLHVPTFSSAFGMQENILWNRSRTMSQFIYLYQPPTWFYQGSTARKASVRDPNATTCRHQLRRAFDTARLRNVNYIQFKIASTRKCDSASGRH